MSKQKPESRADDTPKFVAELGDSTAKAAAVSLSADEIVIRRRIVDCVEGFKLLGAKISPRGAAQAWALVRTGEVTQKRYSIRRRASDGHTVFRWGRLIGAEVIQYGDDPTDFIVVFMPASSSKESANGQ